MRIHQKHVFMCTGPRCTKGGLPAEAMFRRLGEKIDARPELRVKRTRSHCFAVCKGGPILVVYPDGVWYRGVDETALERIVGEHLAGGREVTDYVFHRLGEGDLCPDRTPGTGIPALLASATAASDVSAVPSEDADV